MSKVKESAYSEYDNEFEPEINYKHTAELVGLKFDSAKPDLSLLPIEFLNEVAFAMMHGEKKYGRYNFTNGMSWSRIIAAGLRHLYAFAAGEDLDKESGVSHLGHAGACVLMLVVYFKRQLGEDNRENSKK